MVRNILRIVHRHSRDNVFLSGLNLGGFQKVTLIVPQVASEASNVLMVRNGTLVWDAIRSTSGASPPCLSGRTGKDNYGARVSKGQTKSDQGRKASV